MTTVTREYDNPCKAVSSSSGQDLMWMLVTLVSVLQ